ncbi:MAG: insulinase family protein [Oscillospiraceae bacterium]|nr:insulinase family protein [Oscillospiraceae bacterium]
MDTLRFELLPGVNLTCIQTEKFKTDCLSISLLTQHQRDTASLNAVLPYVLRRGTRYHPDMESIASALDELYGTCIEPVVRRIGEIQCLGFFANIPSTAYLPEGGVLRSAAELMCEMLLSPNTKGGLLLPAYVESEKEKLLERIRGRVNDKMGYSVYRLLEEMCCYEDFAVPTIGTESTAEGIYYQKLTKQYRKLLSTCPVEIFYCGSENPDDVAEIFRDSLCAMPRGEINYDIGTDIRMNSVDSEVRYFTEELNVTQGKLALGFRLGECMEEPDIAAITVFNGVYGGGVTSKLFMNVREKLSLCYYASSNVNTHKGLMCVFSGIDFDKYEDAMAEILAQLEDVKNGVISDEELSAARAAASSALRTVSDSAGELEGFWLSNIVDGLDFEPEELAELCESVSREDVVRIARSVVADAVYFLRGNGEEADDED